MQKIDYTVLYIYRHVLRDSGRVRVRVSDSSKDTIKIDFMSKGFSAITLDLPGIKSMSVSIEIPSFKRVVI